MSRRSASHGDSPSRRWHILPRVGLAAIAACSLLACNAEVLVRIESDPGGLGPPVLPVDWKPTAGHLVGSLVIAGERYGLDGIVDSSGGLMLSLLPQEGQGASISMFTATLRPVAAGTAVGTGLLVGIRCGDASAGRFCDEAIPAEITLHFGEPGHGAIAVSTPAIMETWPLQFGYWGGMARLGYGAAWSTSQLAGLYEEYLAEFSPRRDVVLEVLADGRLGFRSPDTGCVGSGQWIDSRSDTNLYEVELVIEGCRSPYGHLNARFTGMGVYEGYQPWDYGGFGPKMWLASSPGAFAAPVALVTAASGP